MPSTFDYLLAGDETNVGGLPHVGHYCIPWRTNRVFCTEVWVIVIALFVPMFISIGWT